MNDHDSPAPAPSFTCPVCGMTSYNPNDIREGYCRKLPRLDWGA